MRDVDWDRMYLRQAQRAADIAPWLRHLDLRPGDRCIDMGCGPGYFSLLLAAEVGAAGRVYAIDDSATALDRLAREQSARGVANICRIRADGAAAQLPVGDAPADAALVAMMLHHAEDPAGVLGNVARLVRPMGRVVVAEFRPDAPGAVGPALARRLAPEAVRAWCEAAGLEIILLERGTPEHYLLVCRRPAAPAGSPS